MSRAFRIDLNGAQEVPPNGSTASGLGVAVFDDSGVNPTLDYTMIVRGLDFSTYQGLGAPQQTPGTTADNVSDGHFHQALPGTAAGVVFGWKTADVDDFTVSNLHLDGAVPVATLHGIWETTDGVDLNTKASSFTNPALVLGSPTDIYANVHTVTVPGGEIRGQLVLLSTDAGETINGVAGVRDDILPGLGGDDRINGLAGNDTIDGGSGNDQLEGGAGADSLAGGTGFDYARYGNSGGPVTADLANSALNAGSDAIGDTYSSIEGLVGSIFDDSLYGDDNVNDLAGLGGNDSLYGRLGNDNLQGMDGDDNLEGGPGADALKGGDGFDLARYDGASSAVIAMLFNRGANTGDAAGDVYTSIEGLAGSLFNDLLVGDSNANTLLGLDGNDNLQGREGTDTLSGGNGVDHLQGGAGADVLDGGADFDYARYDGETSGVIAALIDASVNGGAAAGDTYVSIEGLVGSHFDDFLAGDDNANDLVGLGGNDQLIGLGGDDNLRGGTGTDQLTGGTGNDNFRFRIGDAQGDLINDFDGQGAALGDRLFFEGYGAGTFIQLNATEWQITSEDLSVMETLTFFNAASIDASDYTFV